MLTLFKVSIDLHNIVSVDNLYVAYKKMRDEIDKKCTNVVGNYNWSVRKTYNDPFVCFQLSIRTRNLFMGKYLYKLINENTKHNQKIIF